MNTREAGIIAKRIWETGVAMRSLGGECLMGPVRPDGTFAGYYRGKSWGVVVKRALSSRPYDGFAQTSAELTGGAR